MSPLRTAFPEVNGEPCRRFRPNDFPLQQVDLSNERPDTIAQKSRAKFKKRSTAARCEGGAIDSWPSSAIVDVCASAVGVIITSVRMVGEGVLIEILRLESRHKQENPIATGIASPVRRLRSMAARKR